MDTFQVSSHLDSSGAIPLISDQEIKVEIIDESEIPDTSIVKQEYASPENQGVTVKVEQLDNDYNNTKPHICDQCNRGFETSTRLRVHKSMHGPSKLFKCGKCGTSFKTLDVLAQHYELHGSGKLPECTHCSQLFSCQRHLDFHISTHHNEDGAYKCTVCEKEFPNPKKLKKHMAAAPDHKPHKCSTCGALFHTNASLTRHMRIHSFTHNCEYCDRRFSSDIKLHEHMNEHRNKPYECAICGSSFTTKKILTTHVRGHIMKHKCKQCDTHFSSVTKLRVHMIKHWDKCPHCDKMFKPGKSMLTHLLTHKKDKKFECEFCGEAFKTESVCRAHVCVVDEYECKKCKKLFACRENLDIHICIKE